MLWFILGLFVGGFIGMFLIALMVASKEADEHLESDGDMPSECLWCGERMAKHTNGKKVCPNCGWKDKEGKKHE